MWLYSSLPAATKLGQGNIFTSVCQEFCPMGGEGVCLSACWDTPPRDQPHHPLPPGTSHTPPGPGTPPPRPGTSPGTSHTTPPPGPGTPPPPPQTRHTPPGPGTPPPRETDCSIRSTSGRCILLECILVNDKNFKLMKILLVLSGTGCESTVPPPESLKYVVD